MDKKIIKNKNIEQKNQELSIWKKHFSGWNFVINALIALIPASLVIGILREMGFRGALVICGVLWGFIYLVGLLREKIGKRSKKVVEKIEKVENEKVIRNDKPKNKKTIWIVILLVGIGAVIFLSILNNQQKSTNKNLTLTKTVKERIIGNLYRNNQYKFRIKFPNDWEIKDGDGPHIIKKATKNGSTIFVYVRDFFEGETGQLLLNELRQEYKKETGINISENEAKQIMAELTPSDFSNEEFKKIMRSVSEGILSKSEDAKILNESIRYIDNEKAFYVKAEIPYKVLDLEVQMIMVFYVTLHNGNIYMIGGGSPKDDFPFVEKQINSSIASFVFENF